MPPVVLVLLKLLLKRLFFLACCSCAPRALGGRCGLYRLVAGGDGIVTQNPRRVVVKRFDLRRWVAAVNRPRLWQVPRAVALQVIRPTHVFEPFKLLGKLRL